MVQVPAATLYNGRSHLNPSERSKVTLLTKHGREFELEVSNRYAKAVKENKKAEFKIEISIELNELNKKLSHFLRDDDMMKKYKMNEEDDEGWRIYREMSDEYSVLAYFSKK